MAAGILHFPGAGLQEKLPETVLLHTARLGIMVVKSMT